MAALNPIRRDFQTGSLASSLASSATSIVLTPAPGFPTLGAGDYVPISLIDGNTLVNSEIIYLTQYTSGNTTGGILRAQETADGGGSARSWQSSASWEHAPTAFDINAHPNVSIGGNTAGAPALISSGTAVFAGGNNITLSQAGSTITVSAASQTVQTQNLHADVIAGNTSGVTASISSGTMTLAGGNNITLSQAGNAVTISAASQTVQTQNSVLVNGSSGAISISGGANVTVGNNASTVTVSVAAQSVQTQSIIRDVNIGGNTSGTTADITSGTLFLAGGNSITLSQSSNSITISGATTTQSVQTQGIQSITAGTAAGGLSIGTMPNMSAGNFTLYAGSGMFFAGPANSSALTIAPTYIMQVNIAGNTSGGTTNVPANNGVTLAGGNNITLSQNQGLNIFNQATASITISGPNMLSVGMSTNGNTSGTTGLVSNRLVLMGGNNVTLSESTATDGASITISAASQTVQTQNVVVPAASNTTYTSGTVVFSGGNNVTVGTNAQTITVSAANVLSVGVSTGGNTAGNTAIRSDQVVFAGGNNITLSESTAAGGATITISAANAAGGIALIPGTSGNTSGTIATLSSGTVGLVGGSNITISQSSGTNSTNLVIVGPTQSNQTVGLYALGNTTQNSSTTLDARTISLNGLGIVSVGYSNGSVQISASQSAQTQSLLQAVIPGTSGNTSGTIGSISTGTFALVGGSNITISQSSGTNSTNLIIVGPTQSAQTQSNLQAVIPGTSGNTSGTIGSISTGTFAVVGGNNITISQSSGTNSTNINIVGPNQMTLNGSSRAALSISGGNGITVGNNASTITISAANQSNQTVGLYAVGNTTQNSSTTLDARTLSFDGLGAASVGYSNGSIQISVPAVVAQTNQTIGIYGSSNTSGTSTGTLDARSMTFLARGGVSVDMTNGVVNISGITSTPQTNQTIGVYASSQTTGQSSSNTVDARSFTHRGMGAVSVGMSGNELIISSPNTIAQTNQTIGLYASSNSSGTSTGTADARSLTFLAKGGVSVDMTNGLVNISGITSTPQTNQTVGLYALGNTTQNSSTTLDARTLSFNGLGGATVGYSNGSIQISAPTTAAQTNQSLGIYALGNTTGQSSSSTYDARTLSIEGDGIVSVGWSNSSLRISASQSVQTQSLMTVNGTNGAVSISGGANVTVGNNASTITISAAAQTNQTGGIYALGNTTGQSSSSTYDLRTLSVVGDGIISAGWSNSSLRISASQSAQTQSLLQAVIPGTSGNTSGTIGSISTGTFAIVGGNAITISQSSGTNSTNINIVGPTPLTLNGSNGAALSVSGGNNITVGNNASTITVSGPNMLSVGVSTGGNTSGATAMRSDQVVFAGGNNITLSETTGAGGATITISAGVGPGIFSAGVSTGGNTAGNTGMNTSQMVLVGSNMVSLSQATAAGGAGTVTINATQSVQTQGIQSFTAASANGGLTLGTMPNITAGAVSLFAGSGMAFVGDQTASALTISPTYIMQVNIAGNTSGNTTNVPANNGLTLAGGNNVTLSQNQGVNVFNQATASITISAQPGPAVSTMGNTSGNTGTYSGQPILAGGNNITLSQSTAAGGGTITISAPNAMSMPFFEPYPVLQSGSTTFAPGLGTWIYTPVQVPGIIGSGRINVIHSQGSTSSQILQASSVTSFATGTTGTAAQSFVLAKTMAFYSRGTGTNNTRLESAWSNTFNISISETVGVSTTNASQLTINFQAAIVFPGQVGSDGAYTLTTVSATQNSSFANSSTNTQAVTAGLSSIYNILSGVALVPVGFNTTLSGGNWWVGQGFSTARTSAGTALPVCLPNLSQQGMYGASSYSARPYGQTVASSGSAYMPGFGMYSATSSTPPNNIAFTDIRSYASNVIPYFNVIASSLS